MRICTKCGRQTPIDQMTKDRRRRDGLGSWCCSCQSGATARSKATRDTDEQKRYALGYHHRRKTDPQYLQTKKAARIKARYGITLEDVEAMKRRQDGLCAICREPRTLVIDHCHASGRVRGLLCQSCNVRLAGLENQEWATKAKTYLDTDM